MRFPTMCLVFILAVASGCGSSGGQYIYRDADGRAIPGEKLELEEKSEAVGVLLAIFPGILWHGIGHRYAGDAKKAAEIEQFEMLSLLGMGAGVGFFYAGEAARREDLDITKISLYISAGTFAGFGSIGFLGSWIYDIIYTPSAVRRHNKLLYVDEKQPEQDDDEKDILREFQEE